VSVLFWGLAARDVRAMGKCCGHKGHGDHKAGDAHGDHDKAESHEKLASAQAHADHAQTVVPGKDKKGPDLPKCPVMGGPIDFSVRALTDDGPVYFCCKSCVKKFTANPEKYAAKTAKQRKALRALPRVQVACPITGRPVNQDIFVKHGERKVYFCCKDCPAGYGKDPDSFDGRLEASYTYQTRCPVMGEEIAPGAYVDLTNGHRVYFCCKGCDKKFLKAPAKYVPRLKAQGVDINPANVKRLSKARGGNIPTAATHAHSEPK